MKWVLTHKRHTHDTTRLTASVGGNLLGLRRLGAILKYLILYGNTTAYTTCSLGLWSLSYVLPSVGFLKSCIFQMKITSWHIKRPCLRLMSFAFKHLNSLFSYLWKVFVHSTWLMLLEVVHFSMPQPQFYRFGSSWAFGGQGGSDHWRVRGHRPCHSPLVSSVLAFDFYGNYV